MKRQVLAVGFLRRFKNINSEPKLLPLKYFIGPGLAIILTIFFVSSCGIHLKVHNPKKKGKQIEFTQADILLGELTKYRDCFDVHYYDLSLEIDPESKSIDGKVDIYAITTDEHDTIQLDLHPNFEISRLYDKQSGEQLGFRRVERAIFIHIPQETEASFVITIEYNGKPMKAKKPPWLGGFVWKKDKNKKPWIGVTCESRGASIWWPLKDHPSDEPDSMRMHYTVPEGVMAVGNGQFEGREDHGRTTTYNWFVSYPINTYNVTVSIGDFKLIEDEYIGINGKELPLQYYVLEHNYEKAKTHFQQVHPILESYEYWFGEYPWYKDGFKLIETPYSGMEHQTAIAYGSRYKNDMDSVSDYLLVHEIAHEWWGNSLTAKDFSDMWLQEGFASYSEALYFEYIYNRSAYENVMYWHRIFIKNKYPLKSYEDRRWFHFRQTSDVYSKGAWVLHTLRNQIDNDSLFFDIIKSFYETYKYQLVESQHFIDLVNEKTKHDYSWFFDQYLNDNFVPHLQYAFTYKGFLCYRWTNVKPEFDKLKVKLVSQDDTIFLTPSLDVQALYLEKDSNGWFSFGFRYNALVEIKENNKLLHDQQTIDIFNSLNPAP